MFNEVYYKPNKTMYLTLNHPRSLAQILAPWVLVIGAIARSFKDAMIYMADIVCSESAPDWVVEDCAGSLGGVVAVGFLDDSVDVGATDAAKISSLSSEVFWSTQMGASPNLGWVLKKTRGSLPLGTPTEEDGYGLASVKRNGADFELSFEVLGAFLLQNRNFVKAMNKRSAMGFVFVTAAKSGTGYEAYYVENAAPFMGLIIEQSIKSTKRYGGSVKWSSDGDPGLPFVAPSTIFI